jgi:hypothetical protein
MVMEGLGVATSFYIHHRTPYNALISIGKGLQLPLYGSIISKIENDKKVDVDMKECFYEGARCPRPCSHGSEPRTRPL